MTYASDNNAQNSAPELREPLHIPPDLPLGEAALRYARAGIRVFRVRQNKVPYANCPWCDKKSSIYVPHEPAECQCGVDTCHAHHSATTDLRTLERWWTEEPDANIGAPCLLNGWAVADVDPRNGGDISYALIEGEVGLLPGTTLQVTGGGGFHALYRAPEFTLPGVLADGIEIKLNGYILLAPSLHASGARYRWVNDLFHHPVVPWPKQLTPASALPKPERSPMQSVSVISHAEGLDRVRMKCQEINQVDYGNAATDVWKLSVHVGQYVAEGQVPKDAAWALLEQALDGWQYGKYGDENALRQSLVNGFRKGLNQPREAWTQVQR
ncbi:bifunctional DNA primase/polymerase [Streptomyces sp. NPDC005065]|uniref:bifunctional DNA primase/polymerase n=1 Tax=Streptomyces sp. NPDC005065 TaxID=3154461 RepID=UPI0033BCD648